MNDLSTTGVQSAAGKRAGLRNNLIRLAHTHSELRPHLLPLLRQGSSDVDKLWEDLEAIDTDIARAHQRYAEQWDTYTSPYPGYEQDLQKLMSYVVRGQPAPELGARVSDGIAKTEAYYAKLKEIQSEISSLELKRIKIVQRLRKLTGQEIY